MAHLSHNPEYESVQYHLVYSMLIHAARTRGTVTHKELALLLGMPVNGNYVSKRLAAILGAVSQNELNQQRPMLSALAISVMDIPAGSFFTLARETGELFGNSPAEEREFWEEQKRRVYKVWEQRLPKRPNSEP